MLLVISPAKTLDFETPSPTKQFSDASFLDGSAELIDQLKTLSPSDVPSLMSISDKLGAFNSNRFVDWQLPFTASKPYWRLKMMSMKAYKPVRLPKKILIRRIITCEFCLVYMDY